ncbi:MAG: hypothetical protein QF473_23160, partial [Planctomycetota bacterium]|nr:hypothetical protein [Planctomycetota bacterium]
MLRTHITRIVYCILLGWLVSPSTAHAEETANLVKNPSCEAAEDNGRPVGWSYLFSSGGACDFVVDGDVKRTGKGSIRLANHKGGAKYPRIVQSVSLEANMHYRLAGWVRSAKGWANLQVTPDKATWFGNKRYGGAVGIAPNEEWRRVEKEFTTTVGGKANIVFTLSTPKREAVDLWVDDVSLVKEGPRLDPRRFIPPVDTSVILPQIGWAKNLPGSRRRVLFIAPSITIRDVIELAQRMNVEAEIHYAPQGGDWAYWETSDLLKLLEKPRDAIVLASVDWESLGRPVREALWSKVRAGTGLFLANPIVGDAELKRVLDTLEPSQSRGFFTEEKKTGLPYLDWVRKGAGLRTGTLGKGRVAVTDYARGESLKERKHWGKRVCSLFPPHKGRVPRADEMPWWEPCYALFARATLWAAGSAPVYIVRVSAEEVGRDAATVNVQIAATRRMENVRLVCIGPGNREVARATGPIDPQTGRASVTLRAPFLSGKHFVWFWVQDDEGKVLGWAAHLFRVPGPSLSVTTDRDRYERGDPVRGTVKTSGEFAAGAQIEVSLVDGHDRVVDRVSVDAPKEVSFKLASEDVASITARVVGKLSRTIDGEPRIECE